MDRLICFCEPSGLSQLMRPFYAIAYLDSSIRSDSFAVYHRDDGIYHIRMEKPMGLLQMNEYFIINDGAMSPNA